jgi:hypothetical protein
VGHCTATGSGWAELGPRQSGIPRSRDPRPEPSAGPDLSGCVACGGRNMANGSPDRDMAHLLIMCEGW